MNSEPDYMYAEYLYHDAASSCYCGPVDVRWAESGCCLSLLAEASRTVSTECRLDTGCNTKS